MPNEDRLLAWIERRDGDEVEAAFVASVRKNFGARPRPKVAHRRVKPGDGLRAKPQRWAHRLNGWLDRHGVKPPRSKRAAQGVPERLRRVCIYHVSPTQDGDAHEVRSIGRRRWRLSKLTGPDCHGRP